MPGHYRDCTWLSDPTIYAPARYKRACRYRAFVPDPLCGQTLEFSGIEAGVISEAEGAVRRLNDLEEPALRSLARLLLRTESIASSKVEGLQVSAAALARAEARVESGGKAGPEARAILSNIAAMEDAVHRAATVERFGLADILEVHATLMAGQARQGGVGKLRTSQNWIGGNDHNPCGADFVPPPPQELERLLGDLCDAINDDLLPPLVQAALVHAQFETIHPFDDGNGRTGRALIHVVLRRRGIAPRYIPPISVVLAAGRDRYIAGLSRFRGDSVASWVEQFASACFTAASLAEAYLTTVRQLMEQWRMQLLATVPGLRADASEWLLIEALPAFPVISGPQAVAATGRAKPNVYRALARFEAAGVLIPVSRAARSRTWEAVGLLAILEQLEEGQAAQH